MAMGRDNCGLVRDFVLTPFTLRLHDLPAPSGAGRPKEVKVKDQIKVVATFWPPPHEVP
jgi:hypothetical protein